MLPQANGSLPSADDRLSQDTFPEPEVFLTHGRRTLRFGGAGWVLQSPHAVKVYAKALRKLSDAGYQLSRFLCNPMSQCYDVWQQDLGTLQGAAKEVHCDKVVPLRPGRLNGTSLNSGLPRIVSGRIGTGVAHEALPSLTTEDQVMLPLIWLFRVVDDVTQVQLLSLARAHRLLSISVFQKIPTEFSTETPVIADPLAQQVRVTYR